MVFAQMCKENKKISSRNIIVLIVAFIFGLISILAFKKSASSYLWSYGLYWYPFILIAPPLCIAISGISMLLKKNKWTRPIISFLSLCGDYSFEMYLVHILLIECIPILIGVFGLSQISHLVWILGGVLLFVGCFMLRRFATFSNRLFDKCCSKKS
jgi:peptidoglycan/LPS O-acetylase OafA/YrhL